MLDLIFLIIYKQCCGLTTESYAAQLLPMETKGSLQDWHCVSHCSDSCISWYLGQPGIMFRVPIKSGIFSGKLCFYLLFYYIDVCYLTFDAFYTNILVSEHAKKEGIFYFWPTLTVSVRSKTIRQLFFLSREKKMSEAFLKFGVLFVYMQNH